MLDTPPRPVTALTVSANSSHIGQKHVDVTITRPTDRGDNGELEGELDLIPVSQKYQPLTDAVSDDNFDIDIDLQSQSRPLERKAASVLTMRAKRGKIATSKHLRKTLKKLDAKIAGRKKQVKLRNIFADLPAFPVAPPSTTVSKSECNVIVVSTQASVPELPIVHTSARSGARDHVIVPNTQFKQFGQVPTVTVANTVPVVCTAAIMSAREQTHSVKNTDTTDMFAKFQPLVSSAVYIPPIAQSVPLPPFRQ